MLMTARIIRDVHDQQVREMQARIPPAPDAPDRSGGIRRAVGRAFSALGSGLAADCPPPQPARR